LRTTDLDFGGEKVPRNNYHEQNHNGDDRHSHVNEHGQSPLLSHGVYRREQERTAEVEDVRQRHQGAS